MGPPGEAVLLMQEPKLLIDAPEANPCVRIALHERIEPVTDAWSESALCSNNTRSGVSGKYDDPCLGRAEVPISICKDGTAVATEVAIGDGWRISLSLQLTPPPPAQDQVPAAVLQIFSIAILPTRAGRLRIRAGHWSCDLPHSESGDWRNLLTSVHLARPAAQPLYLEFWEYNAPVPQHAGVNASYFDGNLAPSPANADQGLLPTPRSSLRDVAHGTSTRTSGSAYAWRPGGEALLGTARMEVHQLGNSVKHTVQLAPEVLWAPLEPTRAFSIKMECTLVPRGAAIEWQESLLAAGDAHDR